MAFNSPPPSDDCPELTPDNGTPTSSSSGSVNWNQITRHWAEDAGNRQQHNNPLYIFNNDNHQASPSALSTIPEHDDTPAPEGQTSVSDCTGSPHAAPPEPPQSPLYGPTRIGPMSPLDIGSPLVPLESSLPPCSAPGSPRAIRFEIEPTAINSSPPSSSRHPTTTPQSGRAQEGRGLHGGLRRLICRLPNFSSWFTREDSGEAQPRRRLSLRWFGRRRNGGS